MTFDSELLEVMEDSVTLEPFLSQDADLKATVDEANPVTYANAVVEHVERRARDESGREYSSHIRVTLPGLLTIDKRGRITLPARCVPQQPPIVAVETVRLDGVDHTVLVCGVA